MGTIYFPSEAEHLGFSGATCLKIEHKGVEVYVSRGYSSRAPAIKAYFLNARFAAGGAYLDFIVHEHAREQYDAISTIIKEFPTSQIETALVPAWEALMRLVMTWSPAERVIDMIIVVRNEGEREGMYKARAEIRRALGLND